MNRWFPKSADITVDKIKEEFLMAAGMIELHRPEFYIGDNTDQKFIFYVDIQNWCAETLFTPCVKVGMQKFAILLPEDMLAGLSTEQAAEENTLPIQIGYFKSKEDALRWFGLL